MKGLYDRFAATERGGRALAGARLRHEILSVLHQAFQLCRMSQSDLADRMGKRRSAVNQVLRGDGNLVVNTVAEYLFAMGFELDVRLVRAGEPRRATVERREIRPVAADWRVSPSQPTISGVFVSSSGDDGNGRDDAPILVQWEAAQVAHTRTIQLKAEVTSLPPASSFRTLHSDVVITP
jgi:transcriptional regulator with XRE-family HTH domain